MRPPPLSDPRRSNVGTTPSPTEAPLAANPDEGRRHWGGDGTAASPWQTIVRFAKGECEDLSPDVWRWLRRWVHDRFESEIDNQLRRRVDQSDCTQELMVHLCRDLRAFRGDDEPQLRSWLITAIRRHVIDLRRQHLRAQCRDLRREVPLEGVGGSERRGRSPTNPLSMLIQRENFAGLKQHLDQLGEIDQQVLHWRHGQQETYESIADRLGVSSAAVRNRHRRILQRLRRMLDGDDE